MANTIIQLKKSGTTGNTPSTLKFGELALNYADGKLFYKNSGGSIVSLTAGLASYSFSTINASSTLILAGSSSDTLSFAGNNGITITGNSSTKTVTVGVNTTSLISNSKLVDWKNATAQYSLTGGGDVTVSTNAEILWNDSVIAGPVQSTEYGSEGYISIGCPTSGVVTYYDASGSITTLTCTASGIPLSPLESVYYEVTEGQSSTYDQTKFRVVNYNNQNWTPGPGWLLICTADSYFGTTFGNIKWLPGQINIPEGGTYYSSTGQTSWLTSTYATLAGDISGGSANQIPYQTGAGATSFITSPTQNNTFLNYTTNGGFSWQLANGASVGTANLSTYQTVTNATTGTYYTALYNGTSGDRQVYANNAFAFNAATGFVGIGTTSPSTKLHVEGSIRAGTTANNISISANEIRLNASTSTNFSILKPTPTSTQSYRFDIPVGSITANNSFWNGMHLSLQDVISISGSPQYPRVSQYWDYSTITNPSDITFWSLAGNYTSSNSMSYGLGTNSPGNIYFVTNGSEKMRITSRGNALFGRTYSGNERIGLGGVTSTISSATSALGIFDDTVASSAQTSGYTSHGTYLSTQAASFNLLNLKHYSAAQFTIGAGSSVTNQYGFFADGSMVGANNNYGFYSSIPSNAANTNFNFYQVSTAPNYFAGNVGIGTTTPSYKLDVAGTANTGALTVTSLNIVGPSANQIFYETPAGITGFITAPTQNNTFLNYTTNGGFSWQLANGASVGSANVSIYQTVTNATTGTYYPALYNGTSGDRQVYANNALSFNAATGNLGISQTTPTVALDIGTVMSVSQVKIKPSNGNVDLRLNAAFGNADVASLTVVTAYPLAFHTNNSERMRIDSSGNVGIGTSSPTYKLQVNGSFAAITKSFVITHPTKPDKKLRYGSLEGPENGVYIRGRLSNESIIELPEYWTELVDENSITVNLTPIGKSQNLYVVDISNNKIFIGGDNNINCFYTIFAERKDVEKLITEY